MTSPNRMGAPVHETKVKAVMELRDSGMSYSDIARIMNVSRQAVRQMALRAIHRNEVSESSSSA